MPVRDIIKNEFHVPVAVENDVNSAALGELHSGAGVGYPFSLPHLRNRRGGCIIINGQVYSGASFSAGSFGGIVIHREVKNGTDTLEGCLRALRLHHRTGETGKGCGRNPGQRQKRF